MDEAQKTSGGRWIYVIFAIVGGLVALYCAYWFWMRGQLDKGVDDWIAEQRAAGLEIEYANKRLHGFPYRFALTIDAPHVTAPGAVEWRGDKLQIVMQPWNFYHAIGRAPGRNEIAYPNGDTLSVLIRDRSALSVSWDNEALKRVSLVLDDADLVLPEGGYGLDDFALNIATPKDKPENIRFSLDWKQITLPTAPPDTPWLGAVLDRGTIKLEFEGLMATLEENPPAPIVHWALLQNGTMKIPQILINWGPVKLGLKGDMSFDQNQDLAGTISLRLEETDALEATLREAGLLDDESAGYLRAIGQASQNGQFIPIPFRDGGVYFLGQRVTDVPLDQLLNDLGQ